MRPNSYLLNNKGEKIRNEKLAEMFDLSVHYIWKLISANGLTKVSELAELRKNPKVERSHTLFIGEEGGRKYKTQELCEILDRSRAWVLRAYNDYSCITLDDFKAHSIISKRMPKKESIPGDINDIPMGTWEAKNYKCPPASKSPSRVVFKNIRIEEAGRVLTA